MKDDVCLASCTAGSQYVSNNECVDCPSGSTSSGTDATFCTCSVNHYAKKQGNTWTCEPCKTGQTKAATQIPSTDGVGEAASACTAATSCDADQYLTLDAGSNKDYCEACPEGSTSSDGSSRTCTCGADKYAEKNSARRVPGEDLPTLSGSR